MTDKSLVERRVPTKPIPAFDEAMQVRFFALVDRRGDDECWPWLGKVDRKGRGHWSPRAPGWIASRVAWSIANGRDPQGYFVCHSCDEPSCVNPAHLWLGNNAANMADAKAKGRMANQSVTHCPQGHEYSPENTRVRITKRGWTHRKCLTCDRERNRRVYWAKKAARLEGVGQ